MLFFEEGRWSSGTYGEMLEEPGAHDVGGHLGEDTSFLLASLAAAAPVLLVFFARAIAAADGRVA